MKLAKHQVTVLCCFFFHIFFSFHLHEKECFAVGHDAIIILYLIEYDNNIMHIVLSVEMTSALQE